MIPIRTTLVVTALALLSCSEREPDFHGVEPVGQSAQAVTVAEAVNGGCSTTAVWGLSMQIVQQMNCLIPGGALAEVPARPNFQKGAATLAWMQPPAVTGLVAALDEMPSTTFSSQSMLRTVAQQYLLYRWYQNGSCGISLAATPGNSNHESGLAVDVSEHATWQATLEAHGFSWLGSSDPVHFDFAGAGIVDLSGKDVLAFQQLWNLNNPNDPISEDGDYGPETETRLQQSPAEGFTTPPTCGAGGSGGSGGTSASGGSAGSPALGGAGGTGAMTSGGGSGGGSGQGATAGHTGGNNATGAKAGSANADDSSGCGCRAVAQTETKNWISLFALLVFVGFIRPRRR